MSPRPLAILAGCGDFPLLVAEAAVAARREVLIFGIAGEASPRIAAFPHLWLGRGELGRLFGRLRIAGIDELVMIGGIADRRMPRINEIDFGGLWAAIVNWRLLRNGDDSVLRIIAGIIEGHGIRVIGATDIAPSLAVGEGVWTAVAPSDADRHDIEVGFAAARAHGAADRGQAVVARSGAIIARESVSGTDAMLGLVANEQERSSAPAAGVLVKCLKPYQDIRFDMPAIGIETVRSAHRAGLKGIAVGADETLVTDLSGVVAALDQRDMFLIGVRPEWNPGAVR